MVFDFVVTQTYKLTVRAEGASLLEAAENARRVFDLRGMEDDDVYSTELECIKSYMDRKEARDAGYCPDVVQWE